MKVRGGFDDALIAAASVRVDRMRLSRSACFRAAVQRAPATDSPARLMTAEAPSIAAVVWPASPSGRHPTRVMPGTPVPESWRDSPAGNARVSIRTSWPSSAHDSHSGAPRNPLPPATTNRIGVLDVPFGAEVCPDNVHYNVTPELPCATFVHRTRCAI